MISNVVGGGGDNRHITQFPNGLRIIYEKSPSTLPLTSIQAFVSLGSVYEPDHARGISHLIEHMCFKGTKKLPTQVAVSETFDDVGSYVNAYTEKEFTCYVIKCHADSTEVSLRVLDDMLFHSVFDRHEFDAEYKVVIEENARLADEIEDVVVENIEKMLYKDTPYAEPVDSLAFHPPHRHRGILWKDAVPLYQQYYIPQNVVLSIVSSLSWPRIQRMLSRSWRRGGGGDDGPTNHII